MNLLHGVGDFFSLDIGTNSMRIVQLFGDEKKGWTLSKYAYVPIDQKLTADATELGRKRLGEAVLGAVYQAGIKTKNAALGLPASKTFTSIVETDTLPDKELAKAFKYEIDKYVPMPMSEAKADYIILGDHGKKYKDRIYLEECFEDLDGIVIHSDNIFLKQENMQYFIDNGCTIWSHPENIIYFLSE